jgi:RNase P subunit RPR2
MTTDSTKHVVCIAGKRNVDKLSDKLSDKLADNKLLNNPNKHQRSRTLKWTIDAAFFNYDKQLEVLRRLIADDTSLEERKFFKKEIKAKLDGYARQDKENGISDPDLSAIISLDATVELLLISKLRCVYCRECCELIYKDVMAPRQWTLDRVDNDQGHNAGNVVLACLACNLQRRTMDAERFKFGKQLRVVKGF